MLLINSAVRLNGGYAVKLHLKGFSKFLPDQPGQLLIESLAFQNLRSAMG